MTVAFPTSERFRARPDKTTAPSTPMNTQSVTSIVETTWSFTLPHEKPPWPQKSNVKLSRLKKNKVMVMKAKIGTSFAIVVMMLIIDASWIPRKMSEWTSQSIIDAPMMEAMFDRLRRWGRNNRPN